MLYKRYAIPDTKTKVYRAATYAGHASAMITNAYMAGCPERANAWQAEQAAWDQRRDKLIAEANAGRVALANFAAETALSSYQASAFIETR